MKNTEFGFALFGGPEGDRTLDLRVANAALSQLSHGPLAAGISFKKTSMYYYTA